MPKRKELYKRLKFRTCYNDDNTIAKGERDLILDWGSYVSLVGYVIKKDDGYWHSFQDVGKCRGHEHLFDPNCFRQKGKTIGKLKETLMEAFKESVIEMEKDFEEQRENPQASNDIPEPVEVSFEDNMAMLKNFFGISEGDRAFAIAASLNTLKEENQKRFDDALEEAIKNGDFDGMEIRGTTFEKDGKKYDGARVFPSKDDIEEL